MCRASSETDTTEIVFGTPYDPKVHFGTIVVGSSRVGECTGGPAVFFTNWIGGAVVTSNPVAAVGTVQNRIPGQHTARSVSHQQSPILHRNSIQLVFCCSGEFYERFTTTVLI